MTEFIVLLGVLVFFHFVADYTGLQGDFMARAKNCRDPIPGIPYQWPLTAHSFIHASLVFVATGIWWFFVVEFLGHWYIDHQKCKGEITFTDDQHAHLVMKVIYAALAIWII